MILRLRLAVVVQAALFFAYDCIFTRELYHSSVCYLAISPMYSKKFEIPVYFIIELFLLHVKMFSTYMY